MRGDILLDRPRFDYKVGVNRDVRTQLIKKCSDISLVKLNRFEKVIEKRLQQIQRSK